jgi:hypothetical protein
MKSIILTSSFLLLYFVAQSQIGYYPPKKSSVSKKKYDENIEQLKRLYERIEGGGTDEALANYIGNIPYMYLNLGVETERIYEVWQKSYAIYKWVACTKLCYEQGRPHQPEIDQFRNRDTVLTKKWCDQCQIVFDSMTEAFNKRRAMRKQSLDSTLVRELHIIYEDDQLYRHNIDSFPHDSKEREELWAKQKMLDSLNVIKIKAIIKKYGKYPGGSLVGDSQRMTAFFVIQHANQETQEEYLPLVKDAVLKKEIGKIAYIMLIDRVYSNRHETQLFNTQSYWDDKTHKYVSFPIDKSEEAQKIIKEINSIE